MTVLDSNTANFVQGMSPAAPSAEPADIRQLEIRHIDRSRTQVRAALNQDTVNDYAIAKYEGEQFPPAIVFFDGENYWLADGFHRVQADEENDEPTTECDIRIGSFHDALEYALAANVKHGLPMSREDKRHAIAMALAEFPNLTDRAIANMVGVSPTTVGDARKRRTPVVLSKLDNTHDQAAANSDANKQLTKRIGKDGRSYNATKPPKSPAPPADDDEPANVNQIELEMDEAEQAQSNKPQIEQPQVKPGHELVSTAWRKKTLGAYGVLLRLIDKQAGLRDQVDELLYELFDAIEAYGGEEA